MLLKELLLHDGIVLLNYIAGVLRSLLKLICENFMCWDAQICWRCMLLLQAQWNQLTSGTYHGDSTV